MAVMADTAGGHWVTLAQATGLLGVSDRTLRRQISSGELRTQRTGGRRLVWTPASSTLAAAAATGMTMAASDGVQNGAVAVTMASSDHEAAMAANQDTLAATLREWRSLLNAERGRASAAEQAAAMWQERARHLEAQVEQLLARPSHEEEPTQRWWRFWR
jgi:excisionase family DNA binding protein